MTKYLLLGTALLLLALTRGRRPAQRDHKAAIDWFAADAAEAHERSLLAAVAS